MKHAAALNEKNDADDVCLRSREFVLQNADGSDLFSLPHWNSLFPSSLSSSDLDQLLTIVPRWLFELVVVWTPVFTKKDESLEEKKQPLGLKPPALFPNFSRNA